MSRIRVSNQPSKWKYKASELNPADFATRRVKARQLVESTYIKEPEPLIDSNSYLEQYLLMNPETNKELHPEETEEKSCKTEESQKKKLCMHESMLQVFRTGENFCEE